MKALLIGTAAALAMGLGAGVVHAQAAPDNYLIQLNDTLPNGDVSGDTYKNGPNLIQSVTFCCDTINAPYVLWSNATLIDSFDNQFNYYDPGGAELSDTIEISGTAGANSFLVQFNSYVEGGTPLTPLPNGGVNFETGAYQQGVLAGVVSNGDFYNIEFVSSDAPEPATWAMMLAGMGIVGLLARRRTAVAA